MFNGFPPDLFKFLRELKENNNKEWFSQNRDRYKRVAVEPGLAFIEAVGERLPSISKHFLAIAKAQGGSMFRIYRDTRFSKNKAPYKENIGFHFRHNSKNDVHAPGYYLHIEPRGSFIGAGIYMPPTPALNKIRETISDSPAAWNKIKKDKNISSRFGEIQGERLKTVPRGFDKNDPLINDLRLKSIFLAQSLNQANLKKADFVDETIAAFKEATPLMRFLCHALDLNY